jgi:hypothetical protein
MVKTRITWFNLSNNLNHGNICSKKQLVIFANSVNHNYFTFVSNWGMTQQTSGWWSTKGPPKFTSAAHQSFAHTILQRSTGGIGRKMVDHQWSASGQPLMVQHWWSTGGPPVVSHCGSTLLVHRGTNSGIWCWQRTAVKRTSTILADRWWYPPVDRRGHVCWGNIILLTSFMSNLI